MQQTTLSIKVRIRLVAAGLLVGLAGLQVVDPDLAPLAEHRGLCGLVAGLAGVVAVFALHRWRPRRLPAWVLGPAGGGAGSGDAGSGS